MRRIVDRIRLDEVAGRVVAWHNRHPLAQRIAAVHVHDIGEVVLPFAADGQVLAATPLPELAPPSRGLAAWCTQRLQQRRRNLLAPTFSEHFIAKLPPARIGRWARRHAALWSMLPADLPHRAVETDARIAAREAAKGKTQQIELHLLAAALDVGGQQQRVLLGAGGQVLGKRVYARTRVAAATTACMILAALATAVGLPRPGAAPSPSGLVASTVPASAATTAVAASASASAAVAMAVAASHPAAASAATGHRESASSAPAAASVPEPSAATADAQHSQRAQPISIRPSLSDEEKRVAIETSQRLREAAGLQQSAAKGEATANTTAPHPTPGHPVYALVAPPTRLRDESIALLSRAQALQAMDVAPARREVFAARGMWRAAFWPFESLADAERARIVLAGKGLKAEVVEF